MAAAAVAAGATAPAPVPPPLFSSVAALGRACADNSFLRELQPDPQAARFAPNRQSREVLSGHFVPVRPTPLPEPALVIASADMLATLRLDPAVAQGAGWLVVGPARRHKN